ncbi:MAG: hypothetical protein ACK5UO_09180 [Microcystis sp.]|uniref:hypothetical protein n=1 Tax=Microcystis sp. TaxID=1127 RepID=UPI00391D1481
MSRRWFSKQGPVISYQLSVISYQLSVISYQLSDLSFKCAVLNRSFLLSFHLIVLRYLVWFDRGA